MTDEEIAGIMGWRGPGAYTAATLRKIRRIIEKVQATERAAQLADVGATTSLQAVQGVPDGWKLVPVEPTLRMRKAAASFGHPDAGPDYPDGYSSQRGVEAVEAYRHMLDAAPPLSSEQQAEKGAGNVG